MRGLDVSCYCKDCNAFKSPRPEADLSFQEAVDRARFIGLLSLVSFRDR